MVNVINLVTIITYSVNYCHVVYVTTDGVWIGDWIYWPLTHTSCDYISQITDTHRLVSSDFTSRFLATYFNTGTITASLNYTYIKSCLHRRTSNWAQLQLNRGHFTPTSYSSPHRLTINWALTLLTLSLAYNIGTDHIENTALPLLRSCLLLLECVYRAVAQKRNSYICPSRARWILTCKSNYCYQLYHIYHCSCNSK
jgi:hypothetical protein